MGDCDYRAAERAYFSKDFQRAKELLDRIISALSVTHEVMVARYMRGRGYEAGCFAGGVDLDKAYADYLVLTSGPRAVSGKGMVGCARILYMKDRQANKEEILRLCQATLQQDADPNAMMLIGAVNESVVGDFAAAKTWYLRAYARGMPWGLRYYARLQSAQKNYVRAVVAHALAAVTSPFMVLKRGIRTPFG